MNASRLSTRLPRRHRIRSHAYPHIPRRTYVSEHPPPPQHPHTTPPKQPSKVGEYYSTFGSPVLKCFLAALFTYQITYYAWLKLETIEEAHDAQAEISDLQAELRAAVEAQKARVNDVLGKAEEVVDEVREKVGEGMHEVGKSGEVVGRVARGGWWPW
ncbi:hypothetical protein ACN47E_005070 [Coniothyrium glycines]